MYESNKKHVFVSFSNADRKFAQKLIRELRERGIDARSGDEVPASENWNGAIDALVKSAESVIFLLGPKDDSSSRQGREWSAALGAKWEDPDKRLIPVLLGRAEIPSFLAGYDALKLTHPKEEVSSAAERLIDLLKRKPPRAVVASNGETAKRRERLKYIEKAAELLRN